jgi:hypothetical protein
MACARGRYIAGMPTVLPFIKPCLPSRADRPPSGSNWIDGRSQCDGDEGGSESHQQRALSGPFYCFSVAWLAQVRLPLWMVPTRQTCGLASNASLAWLIVFARAYPLEGNRWIAGELT